MSRYTTLKAKDYQVKVKINHISSMFSIFFTDKDVADYNQAQNQDSKLFKCFYHNLLKENVYFSPSGFEADFLSTAHTEKDLNNILTAISKALENLRRN